MSKIFNFIKLSILAGTLLAMSGLILVNCKAGIYPALEPPPVYEPVILEEEQPEEEEDIIEYYCDGMNERERVDTLEKIRKFIEWAELRIDAYKDQDLLRKAQEVRKGRNPKISADIAVGAYTWWARKLWIKSVKKGVHIPFKELPPEEQNQITDIDDFMPKPPSGMAVDEWGFLDEWDNLQDFINSFGKCAGAIIYTTVKYGHEKHYQYSRLRPDNLRDDNLLNKELEAHQQEEIKAREEEIRSLQGFLKKLEYN